MKKKNYCQKNSKSKRIKKHLLKVDPTILFFLNKIIKTNKIINKNTFAKVKNIKDFYKPTIKKYRKTIIELHRDYFNSVKFLPSQKYQTIIFLHLQQFISSILTQIYYHETQTQYHESAFSRLFVNLVYFLH